MTEWELRGKGDLFWRLRRSILLSRLAICCYVIGMSFAIWGIIRPGWSWWLFAGNWGFLILGAFLTFKGHRLRRGR